jgi:hypothetical protein
MAGWDLTARQFGGLSKKLPARMAGRKTEIRFLAG